MKDGRTGTAVCSTCTDTHLMRLEGRNVPCTACPTPCQGCRAGGYGAYCEATPCRCECHRSSKVHADGLTADVARLTAEIETKRKALLGMSGRILLLDEEIEKWKTACGLNDSSGDPSGIEPRHLVELLRVLRHESDVVRRLEVWLSVDSTRCAAVDQYINGVAVALMDRRLTAYHGEVRQTVISAIDVALLEAAS